MTFGEYQQWFQAYDAARGLDADPPLMSLSHLTEEMGEIARHILRLEGVKPMDDADRSGEISDLALELTDAFVFLTKLANSYGIEWEEAIARSIVKAEQRSPLP